MREILFRGKRIDNGEWVYGYYLFKNGKFAIWDNNNISFYEINPETVGQFTGLTDKNGVKIFEGDVLKLLSGKSTFRKCKFELKFYKGMYTLWTKKFTETYSSLGFFFHNAVSEGFFNENCLNVDGLLFKVIGNIHDNPELL